MNRTTTSFGARRLREWIRKPLIRRSQVMNRLDVVEELALNRPACLEPLFNRFRRRLPDLESMLTRLHYRRVNPKPLLHLLNTVHEVMKLLPSPEEVEAEVTSLLLKEDLGRIPHDFFKTLQHWLNQVGKACAVSFAHSLRVGLRTYKNT